MENKTLRDSAAIRWTALLLLALAMFCAYIFVDILSPIKDLMQSQRGWDSDAFGTMQGSETFLNVFIFFLIFAGIILDKMGVRFTALLSGGVMLVYLNAGQSEQICLDADHKTPRVISGNNVDGFVITEWSTCRG